MMSSAISMIAGMEETKVRSASDDLFSSGGEREGVSFATSLNERIGMPASSEGKQAGNDLAIALSSLETATIKKNIEEVAQTPTGGKEDPLADQNASVRNELKCSTPSNIIHTQVAGSGPKLTSENVETNASELPAPVKGDATYGLPRPTLAPGVPDQTPASNVKIANVDRPVAPNSDSPVAQKEPAAEKKVIESGSLKNSAKTQEKPATNSTVQKIAKKTGDATVVAPKPVAGTSTSAIPSAAQVESPKAALPAEISKASDTSSTVVSAVPKPSTGIAPPPVNGQFRKEIASGTNASVTDNSMTPPAVSDSAASSKIDISPQKMMTAVALPDRSDGDNKQQVVRESGVAFLHPAGIVSAAVVPGDSLGGGAVTKQAVGDAGFHSPGSATSSRDQQGVVVGAQSLNEAPRMLSSTPTSLEVGIQNGTHGWLKVRAELTDGGAVNASVSATSSVGQEMLHRELPALAAYLQDEKVAVNAIVVHSAPTGGTDARSSAGTDGAGGQTPQRNNEGEQQHQGLTKTTLNGSDEKVSYRGWHGIDEDGSLPLAAYVSGGIWLSVRA